MSDELRDRGGPGRPDGPAGGVPYPDWSVPGGQRPASGAPGPPVPVPVPGSPAAPAPASPPFGRPGSPPFGYPGSPPVPSRPYAGPPPPGAGWRSPTRVEPVPGTPFALAYLDVPPVMSGPAVGGLVAGVAGLLVTVVVACFGLAGARDGWGALVGGAFAVPAALLGAGAVTLGVLGQRQIRRAVPGRVTGRGLAIAAVACGASAVALTLLALGGAVLLAI
ncbi:MAG TPA: phage holin family protein [Micromonosporaceae bacterium]|nr:phage holin family protein [Micromonosporaceae bacterium]